MKIRENSFSSSAFLIKILQKFIRHFDDHKSYFHSTVIKLEMNISNPIMLPQNQN